MAAGSAMLDPNAAGPNIEGLGSLSRAYSQYRFGQSAYDLGKLRAGMAQTQAQSALEQGSEQESIERQKENRFVGSQQAHTGASGIATTGSALKIQGDTALLAAQDIQRTRMNAAREAWGFRVNASNDLYEGSSQKIAADSAATGTILGAGGKYYKQMRDLGLWTST
jgi:hypothetical protein